MGPQHPDLQRLRICATLHPHIPVETRMPAPRYTSFADFYPFYLSEHQNATSRHLHVLGTSLALGFVLPALASPNAWWLLVALVQG